MLTNPGTPKTKDKVSVLVLSTAFSLMLLPTISYAGSSSEPPSSDWDTGAPSINIGDSSSGGNPAPPPADTSGGSTGSSSGSSGGSSSSIAPSRPSGGSSGTSSSRSSQNSGSATSSSVQSAPEPVEEEAPEVVAPDDRFAREALLGALAVEIPVVEEAIAKESTPVVSVIAEPVQEEIRENPWYAHPWIPPLFLILGLGAGFAGGWFVRGARDTEAELASDSVALNGALEPLSMQDNSTDMLVAAGFAVAVAESEISEEDNQAMLDDMNEVDREDMYINKMQEIAPEDLPEDIQEKYFVTGAFTLPVDENGVPATAEFLSLLERQNEVSSNSIKADIETSSQSAESLQQEEVSLPSASHWQTLEDLDIRAILAQETNEVAHEENVVDTGDTMNFISLLHGDDVSTKGTEVRNSEKPKVVNLPRLDALEDEEPVSPGHLTASESVIFDIPDPLSEPEKTPVTVSAPSQRKSLRDIEADTLLDRIRFKFNRD